MIFLAQVKRWMPHASKTVDNESKPLENEDSSNQESVYEDTGKGTEGAMPSSQVGSKSTPLWQRKISDVFKLETPGSKRKRLERVEKEVENAKKRKREDSNKEEDVKHDDVENGIIDKDSDSGTESTGELPTSIQDVRDMNDSEKVSCLLVIVMDMKKKQDSLTSSYMS